MVTEFEILKEAPNANHILFLGPLFSTPYFLPEFYTFKNIKNILLKNEFRY